MSAGVQDQAGTVTHEGVTMFTNTMSSEDIRAGIDAADAATKTPESTDTTDAPADKKPNPRRDSQARIAQQATELANRDQTIGTLNERLAEIDSLKAKIAELETRSAPQVQKPEPPPAAPSDFSEKEPTIEQFAQSDDPYRDYMRALSKYDRQKEAHETAKTQLTERQKASDEGFKRWVSEQQAAHDLRLNAFVTTKPDAKALFEAEAKKPSHEQIQLTPLMHVAIETHPQGPELILTLLEHPELSDELVLQTSGQRAFDAQRNLNPLVATVQRRLLSRVTAAGSGSAAPALPTTKAHPPINPVSGGHPVPKSGPPGDDAPYEEHERYWNEKERESRKARR